MMKGAGKNEFPGSTRIGCALFPGTVMPQRHHPCRWSLPGKSHSPPAVSPQKRAADYERNTRKNHARLPFTWNFKELEAEPGLELCHSVKNTDTLF
jgi:hypothetical protein